MQNDPVVKNDSPASARLREYLKGLEKKLDSFSNLILSDDAHLRSGARCSTSPPTNHIPQLQNASSMPTYQSERWRAYYGRDFEYIPAKTELDNRLKNDYRWATKKSQTVKYNYIIECIIIEQFKLW